MATFTEQDLNGSSFFKVRLQDSTLEQVDLSGAMLRNVNLTRVKVRGADLTDLELDGEAARLTVHGVDVIPLVEAELDRRHPERAAMRARTPEELRAGWAGLEAMWASTVARARAMPTGTLDVSVDGEWTFTQTLRHLILATDAWLGEAIGKQEKPFHPLGMLFWQGVGEEAEFGLLPPDEQVPFDEVLAVRAGRQQRVRDYLDAVTPETLATVCGGVFGGPPEMTVLDCLQIIVNEEWHHHRYAVRDLDAIEAGQDGTRFVP